MAVNLTDNEITDLVTATQRDLGRLKFQQIAQRLQSYEVMPRLLRKERMDFQGGNLIQRNLMIDHSGAAKNVGLYEPDKINVGDVLKTMSIPWRHTTTHYAYERREILINAGQNKIVDLVKVRRTDAMLGLAEHLEKDFWSAPAASTDELRPFGLFYWLTYNATVGHNGGDPGGFTAGRGGLSSSTAVRWKNYTGQYAAVSKADLIMKMRTAHRKIRFKSPVDVNDYRKGTGDQYRIYMGEATLQDFEDVAESQNQNLGRDVASMDGVTTFKRNAMMWIPQLDSYSSSQPVIMLNWAHLSPVFLKGDYMRETDARVAPNQHNVYVVFIDLTWNMLMTDLRSQCMFAKSDPALELV